MKRVIIAATRRNKFDSVDFASNLRDELNKCFGSQSRSYCDINSQYNEIEFVNCKFKQVKAKKLTFDALHKLGYDVFVPRKSNPYEFVVISNDIFITLNISVDGFENIYVDIYYDNANIMWESWYNRYLKSKE